MCMFLLINLDNHHHLVPHFGKNHVRAIDFISVAGLGFRMVATIATWHSGHAERFPVGRTPQ